jgi:hypothetical protein
MDEILLLHVPFQNQVVDLRAEVVGESVSLHTGRRLRRAESAVTASSENSPEFRTVLEEAVAADDDGNNWAATIQTESFANDGSHEFAIEWSEHEELHAKRVEFEGLALTPTQYKEDADPEDDGVVAINFLATLTPDEVDRLRELEANTADPESRYWPVLRVGISENPRTMRVGQLLWSKRDDGNVDYLIVLVDAANDDAPQKRTLWLRMAGEPALPRAMTALTDLSGRFEALLGLLEQGTPIDGNARQLLNDAGQKAVRTKHHTFFEVDNVADWWM